MFGVRSLLVELGGDAEHLLLSCIKMGSRMPASLRNHCRCISKLHKPAVKIPYLSGHLLPYLALPDGLVMAAAAAN